MKICCRPIGFYQWVCNPDSKFSNPWPPPPLPGINLIRKPTGQSDPYCKLMTPIPPIFLPKEKKEIIYPSILSAQVPPRREKSFIKERKKRGRIGKKPGLWKGKGFFFVEKNF